jgi:hypothetical protein
MENSWKRFRIVVTCLVKHDENAESIMCIARKKEEEEEKD